MKNLLNSGDPSPRAIRKAMRRLEAVVDKIEHPRLRMSQAHVARGGLGEGGKTLCNTTACHGGWYALAKYWDDHKRKLKKDKDVAQQLWDNRGTEYISYSDGVHALAKDLGFLCGMQLRKWAGGNPVLWGNSYGYSMFVNAKAFFDDDVTTYDDVTIHDVIRHWREVAARIEAAQ